MTASQEHYRNSLDAMLRDRDLRVFLWRLIVEDCKVFEESYPTNAQIYSLAALQSMGKRLLADAKEVNMDAVHAAEKEYNDLMNLTYGGRDGSIE